MDLAWWHIRSYIVICLVRNTKNSSTPKTWNEKNRNERGREKDILWNCDCGPYYTRNTTCTSCAWEMTERLHIHFDKTTSRSDGAFVEEMEIRTRGCEREVGCCEIQAHVDLFVRIRACVHQVVDSSRCPKSVSLYFLYMCVHVCARAHIYTHTCLHNRI